MFNEDEIKTIINSFDSELVKKIDVDNLSKIYKYLLNNGIYFVKDLVVDYLDMFINDYEDFKVRFEKLKNSLGSNYIEVLEKDSTLWESLCWLQYVCL